ncbi:unnamed protein product [Rhizoctonia solani]|nr:unnamed protein product [Rhizoctonia solani]
MTVKYIVEQAARCPHQLFVLGGYSKGGMVIHSMNLPKSVIDRVIAIVVFGDPFYEIPTLWPIDFPAVNLNPRAGLNSSDNVISFCNKGDVVCQHSGVNFFPHWTYGRDGSTVIAATFIKKRMKMKQSVASPIAS